MKSMSTASLPEVTALRPARASQTEVPSSRKRNAARTAKSVEQRRRVCDHCGAAFVARPSERQSFDCLLMAEQQQQQTVGGPRGVRPINDEAALLLMAKFNFERAKLGEPPNDRAAARYVIDEAKKPNGSWALPIGASDAAREERLRKKFRQRRLELMLLADRYSKSSPMNPKQPGPKARSTS